MRFYFLSKAKLKEINTSGNHFIKCEQCFLILSNCQNIAQGKRSSDENQPKNRQKTNKKQQRDKKKSRINSSFWGQLHLYSYSMTHSLRDHGLHPWRKVLFPVQSGRALSFPLYPWISHIMLHYETTLWGWKPKALPSPGMILSDTVFPASLIRLTMSEWDLLVMEQQLTASIRSPTFSFPQRSAGLPSMMRPILWGMATQAFPAFVLYTCLFLHVVCVNKYNGDYLILMINCGDSYFRKWKTERKQGERDKGRLIIQIATSQFTRVRGTGHAEPCVR